MIKFENLYSGSFNNKVETIYLTIFPNVRGNWSSRHASLLKLLLCIVSQTSLLHMTEDASYFRSKVGLKVIGTMISSEPLLPERPANTLIDHISTLPEALLLKIFSKLDISTLLKCSQVSIKLITTIWLQLGDQIIHHYFLDP